jgi:7-carboxy-7-deazaguanine synthase
MEKLHYTELFYSIQGEGRLMGVPSVFLRTFGCNFRCKKFNRPRNEVITGPNPEVIPVIADLDKYNKFEDLPVLHTGCDTYASIYPEFKKFAMKEGPEELAKKIVALLPNKKWEDEHFILTGGEPLLAWQDFYPSLLMQPEMYPLSELTFETNGTQKLHGSLTEYLRSWTKDRRMQRRWEDLTFSVSPKLSISGETWENSIKPEVVSSYEWLGYTYVKFVVANNQDMDEAEEAVRLYREAGFNGPVYLMPCGGTIEPYKLNATGVAKLALSKGWRYSDRLQVPLFKNAWGT